MAALPQSLARAAHARPGQLAWGGLSEFTHPRHYTAEPASRGLLGCSVMPQQRLARLAARRAFVELKQRFIDAVAEVEGSRGQWLRRQVRQTEAPLDLWLLRGAVFDALRGSAEARFRTRLDLHQALDSVLPDCTSPAPLDMSAPAAWRPSRD